MDQQIFSHIDPARLCQTFTELVSVDAPSLKERQMADRVAALFRELGATVTEDGAAAELGGNAGNLFITVPGAPEAPPVFFGGHLDTVEPARGKRAVVGPAGKITSAGDTVLGADDLTAVAELLEAVRILQAHGIPHRPLEIGFFVAEELYTLGSRVFDFAAVKAKEAYVLDLSGEIGTAAVRAPTFLYFKATLHGRASHAGFAPERGISAIKAACGAVSHINIGRVDRDTTVAVGIIHGGLATNIVPEDCTVEGEIRSFSEEKAAAALQQVREHFEEACRETGAELAFTVEKRATAYHFPADTPIARRFTEAAQAAGLTPRFIKTFGGSDANTSAERGIPSLVIANGMHGIHTTAEHTTVDDMAAATRLILALAAL